MKRTLCIGLVGLSLFAAMPAHAEEPAPPVVHAHKSNGGFVAGIVFTSLSGVFLAGGIAMFATATGMQNSFDGFGAGLLLDAGGAAMLGGSLAFGITGVYLLAANAPSRSRALEADLRMTAAHDLAPRALSIPIASGSF